MDKIKKPFEYQRDDSPCDGKRVNQCVLSRGELKKCTFYNKLKCIQFFILYNS